MLKKIFYKFFIQWHIHWLKIEYTKRKKRDYTHIKKKKIGRKKRYQYTERKWWSKCSISLNRKSNIKKIKILNQQKWHKKQLSSLKVANWTSELFSMHQCDYHHTHCHTISVIVSSLSRTFLLIDNFSKLYLRGHTP